MQPRGVELVLVREHALLHLPDRVETRVLHIPEHPQQQRGHDQAPAQSTRQRPPPHLSVGVPLGRVERSVAPMAPDRASTVAAIKPFPSPRHVHGGPHARACGTAGRPPRAWPARGGQGAWQEGYLYFCRTDGLLLATAILTDGTERWTRRVKLSERRGYDSGEEGGDR